jgi:tetratricopeptide (TPR) repeat protein
VVLGMHRSGTSLLTNLLTVLGVDVGTNLLAANQGNEAGYWENESIYRTQDALMNFIAQDWGEYGFAYPVRIDWNRLPEMREFQERLISIVRTEMAAAKGIWGFKDPRTCRLLPLWKQIFAELDLEPLYVLAIRDPAVVVDSLLKLYPLDALHGELVWLLYNLDAIRDAGEELRIVVDYDRWFTAPVEQAKAVATALELAWPSKDNDLVAQLTQTIRPDLRHSKTRRPCVLPFVNKTHEMLQQAAATGQAPAKIVAAYLRHAAEGLTAVLELSSGSGHVIVAVGHAELQAGNLEVAEAAFTRAVRLQPKLAAAHSGLALALLTRGRWAEALESVKHAILLDATDSVALRVWARIHLHRGQIDDA